MRNPNPSPEEAEQYPADDNIPPPPHPPLPNPPLLVSQERPSRIERLRRIKDAFATRKRQSEESSHDEALSEDEFVVMEDDEENGEGEGEEHRSASDDSQSPSESRGRTSFLLPFSVSKFKLSQSAPLSKSQNSSSKSNSPSLSNSSSPNPLSFSLPFSKSPSLPLSLPPQPSSQSNPPLTTSTSLLSPRILNILPFRSSPSPQPPDSPHLDNPTPSSPPTSPRIHDTQPNPQTPTLLSPRIRNILPFLSTPSSSSQPCMSGDTPDLHSDTSLPSSPPTSPRMAALRSLSPIRLRGFFVARPTPLSPA